MPPPRSRRQPSEQMEWGQTVPARGAREQVGLPPVVWAELSGLSISDSISRTPGCTCRLMGLEHLGGASSLCLGRCPHGCSGFSLTGQHCLL